MRSTSRIWRLVSIMALLSTLLLMIGFVLAIEDVLFPSRNKAAKERVAQEPGKLMDKPASLQESGYLMTAIGDSLAKGTGDDSGQGFARRVVEEIIKQGSRAELINNLGINGLTTEGLLALLEEKGVQYALKQSNVIMLSIGGNDLFDGGQSLMSKGELPDDEELRLTLQQAAEQLDAAVQRIKEVNPQALLVYIGLYNPFSDLDEIRQSANAAVASWNYSAVEMLSESDRTVVVPTYDLFVLNGGKYLANDHFHPNGDGYQMIAERIVQALK